MRLPGADTEARRVLAKLVQAAERGPLFVLLAPTGERPADVTRTALHYLRRSGWEVEAEWLDGVRQDLLPPELADDWRHVKVHRIPPAAWADAREELLRGEVGGARELLEDAGIANVPGEESITG